MQSAHLTLCALEPVGVGADEWVASVDEAVAPALDVRHGAAVEPAADGSAAGGSEERELRHVGSTRGAGAADDDEAVRAARKKFPI